VSFNSGPNIGDLTRRIVIQRATTSKDAMGQPIQTWATYTTVWAGYSPISDGERVRANEIYANLSARFTIRYSTLVASVDARDRVVFDGRTFDIVGVKETEFHRWLEITAATRGERT
jgi:SPP1 family predicted phage head-tail adaptor